MNWNPARSGSSLRAFATLALLCLALVGCGGGGGGGDAPAAETPAPAAATPTDQGSRLAIRMAPTHTNAVYAISVYLPPASAGARGTLPVVYALDGQSWFNTLASMGEKGRGMIVIGLDGIRRNEDYVPANFCTGNGGGHAAFFDFLRKELIPLVEKDYGGDPKKRVLFGHSHGGALVLYAMFSEAPGAHTFSTYLASDASVSCMPDTARGWERTYGTAHRQLPVKLHLSYATQGNFAPNQEYSALIQERRYEGFTFVSQAYTGTHGGIVPAVLEDGVALAFR